MKVLVTGGAGYVGSHLVDALQQAGHAVRVLDFQPARREGRAAPGYAFIRGSITNLSLAAEAMGDVVVVYHLAWGFYPEDERREVQENLFGTLNLLEAALAAGVRHFLFASTAVVYGPTGPVQVDEQYPCHPERSTIGGPVYGITKLACEKYCLGYQRRGLPVTVFRMHGVFSQGHLGQSGQMIRQALAGEPVRAIQGADGEYGHLKDVLRAFLLAMGNPKAYGEIFNLAGSRTYSDPERAHTIVETTGSESRIELVEDPTQGMISVSVDKLRWLLGCEPEREEFLTGLFRSALDIEKARRSIGSTGMNSRRHSPVALWKAEDTPSRTSWISCTARYDAWGARFWTNKGSFQSFRRILMAPAGSIGQKKLRSRSQATKSNCHRSGAVAGRDYDRGLSRPHTIAPSSHQDNKERRR
jgi:UDP-glucose 4-epimerase